MKPVIIDVREPEEYASGHVAGALNIPPSKLMGQFHELDEFSKDTEIIVYCRTGARSNVAMHILKDKGFTNITNGINAEQVNARYS
jgi:phage shock protein E